jgi:hypothetical protein
MADELELDELEETETDDIAARVGGDGFPLGNEMTPMIGAHQVETSDGGVKPAVFDDDAMATIIWYDFQRFMQWLDNNSWLAEWQYVDYLYQSPNYDGDWRTQSSRPARISRFNVAKNRNTMSTQVRRGIFADANPFLIEPIGKFAGLPDVQIYVDAITEIFSVLDKRGELEYNMELFIDCQVLQGTAIAIPIWEQKTVVKKTRKPVEPPQEISMPDGTKRKIHTLKSDKYKTVSKEVEESWPCFEYRRLGTTIYDPKWRTPNRPDLSAGIRIDIDYVSMQDLQQMRKKECYKDIPDDKQLETYFLQNPNGDAQVGSQVAQSMNTQTSDVLHAEGEHANTSQNPLRKPIMKLSYWTCESVAEMLVYPGGRKIIRKEDSPIGDHGLGYSATWWNIENSGYGIGQGRLNAGDQRMDQGVLNEVLKMIAFPMNAPILYNSASGNAPTQNVVQGMGTFWGVEAPDNDVRKAFGFMQMPVIPADAWKIYELGKEGGEDIVGANSTTMQGNVGGPGATALRTAAGVNRIGGKADENIATPVQHLEYVMTRWYSFLWDMVTEIMPIAEIRAILSDKYSDAIIDLIDSQILLNATFNIKILAGQKLAARQAIAQIIPFLLQLVQQPQLLQYMHEKGWTVNFLAIEKIFLRVSELQGADDIIVPLSDQEKQQVQQMNPNAMKAQIMELLEKLKQEGKLEQIKTKGALDVQHTIVDKTLDHISGEVPLSQGQPAAPDHTSGSVPLDLAEARLSRNTDMDLLQHGFGGS